MVARLLRKIIRICQDTNRITSLADFIAVAIRQERPARRHLSPLIAVVGIVSRTSRCSSRAISSSFTILRGDAELATTVAADPPILTDTALYVALAARRLHDRVRRAPSGQPPSGTRAWSRAIAFESLVKLVAFLAVGLTSRT